MSKVMYLTTSLLDNDFNYLCSRASITPNPAGQNFHLKLIEAVSLAADSLHVISLIPNKEEIIPANPSFTINGINRTYLNTPASYFGKIKFIRKLIKDIVKEKPDYVFYDSLNVAISRIAYSLRKKKIKTIAILTDDPTNISGTNNLYSKLIFKYSKNAYEYFALTPTLNERFNKKKANCLICEGIIDIVEKPAKPYQNDYIYYGGALFIKDGTEALISSYLENNPDYDLVISGHGDYEEKVKEAAKNNPRIKFLGQISKLDNFAYQCYSSLNINPRKYRIELDKVSIPSKVLEYLQAGQPIASTLSTPLFEIFSSSINEIDSSININDALNKFFKEHLDENKKFINLKENNSENIILEKYSVKSVSSLIKDTLLTK